MLAAWKKSDDPPYWTKNRPHYETWGGMQIRFVDSKTGPYNNDFKKALWNSNNVTKNQVCCVDAWVWERQHKFVLDTESTL